MHLVEDQTDRRTHYCQPVKMQPAQSYVERPATQRIYDTSRSVQRETERTSQPRPKLEGNYSQQIEDWRQAPMVSANGSFNSNQRPAPSRRSSLTASSKGRRSYPDRQIEPRFTPTQAHGQPLYYSQSTANPDCSASSQSFLWRAKPQRHNR